MGLGHALLLFVSLPVFAQTESKTTIQYWKETGLELRHFEENALDLCYRDASNFMACVNALNVMAGLLDERRVFVAESERTLGHVGEVLIKHPSGLHTHRFIDFQPNSPHAVYEYGKKKRDVHLAAMTDLFHKTVNTPSEIPFIDWFRSMKPQVMTKYSAAESFLAATLFNSFFKDILDPHAHVDPVAQIDTRMKDEPADVQFEVRTDTGVRTGYIRIGSFMSDSTGVEVGRAVEALQKEQVEGLILDLRGNRGGSLAQAISVAATFLGKKHIVTVRDIKNPKIEQHRYGDHWQLTRLPLATLIDGYSSSASEVLAGALQHYRRSWIIGQRSSGKGTVQTPVYFKAGNETFYDQIYLFKTRYRYYLPSGLTNQIHGIIPSFMVGPALFFREEDRFTNAYSPEGEAWEEDRPRQVARIQRCLRKQNTDDPVLFAERVLSCDSKTIRQYRKSLRSDSTETAVPAF